MGLNFGAALLLGHVIKHTGLKDEAVYCLGYPTNNITRRKLGDLAKALDYELPASFPQKPETTDVMKFLGCGTIHAIDITDYEGADIVMDLAADQLASEHHGKAGLIFDSGTMEHIPNPYNAMCALHDLLKPGGVCLHINPANGCVDHGFWQISPTFYNDWYRANNYEIITASFSHLSTLTGSVDIEPYTMDLYRNLKRSDLLRRYGHGYTLFAARKTQASTRGVLPVQSFYKKRYQGEDYGYDQTAPLKFKLSDPVVRALVRKAVRG